MEERKAFTFNGFVGVLLIAALVGLGVLGSKLHLLYGIICIIIAIVLASGLVIVQPNQALVLTFFGNYVGSIRVSGFFLTVPLTYRKKVSLRIRNFNSKKLKVNDIEGNPIEIAAVVVYKVVDSFRAIFNVDDYEKFVDIQSEAALRHVASKYPYDSYEEDHLSLRANTEEITEELARELQERLELAGVEVIEARLAHLAYSPEIAQAMLQRQQANAIIAARRKIVESAVGMAQLAIEQLEKEHVLDLDEERKVQMVNNLMVAIISDKGTQPILNTGSLY